MAETVVTLDGQKVKTVNGKEVRITVITDSYRGNLYQNNFGAKHTTARGVNAAGVKVDNAKVTTTDIVCDNGKMNKFSYFP